LADALEHSGAGSVAYPAAGSPSGKPILQGRLPSRSAGNLTAQFPATCKKGQVIQVLTSSNHPRCVLDSWYSSKLHSVSTQATAGHQTSWSQLPGSQRVPNEAIESNFPISS
jgi:hypothetical protein